mmetsp:Transcript_38873/g.54740  ORF Transcript_38873/g.54740 Transcript_38873/m.54740 type:complete len:84 (-) Transcript_38873:27-278(-)
MCLSVIRQLHFHSIQAHTRSVYQCMYFYFYEYQQPQRLKVNQIKSNQINSVLPGLEKTRNMFLTDVWNGTRTGGSNQHTIVIY